VNPYSTAQIDNPTSQVISIDNSPPRKVAKRSANPGSNPTQGNEEKSWSQMASSTPSIPSMHQRSFSTTQSQLPEVIELKQIVANMQAQVQSTSSCLEEIRNNQRVQQEAVEHELSNQYKNMQAQIEQASLKSTAKQAAMAQTFERKISNITTSVTALTVQVSNQRDAIRDDVQTIVSASQASMDRRFEQLLTVITNNAAQHRPDGDTAMQLDSRRVAHPEEYHFQSRSRDHIESSAIST
jgi:vacuolar-type H+-ATPase subunit I/STV1